MRKLAEVYEQQGRYEDAEPLHLKITDERVYSFGRAEERLSR